MPSARYVPVRDAQRPEGQMLRIACGRYVVRFVVEVRKRPVEPDGSSHGRSSRHLNGAKASWHES